MQHPATHCLNLGGVDVEYTMLSMDRLLDSVHAGRELEGLRLQWRSFCERATPATPPARVRLQTAAPPAADR